MIFSLDFWVTNGWGFGFTVMVREDLGVEGYHRYSCFEWQVKAFGRDLHEKECGSIDNA